jgi:hypothetical protein
MDGKLQMLALLARVLKLTGPEAVIGIQNTNVTVVLSAEDQMVL